MAELRRGNLFRTIDFRIRFARFRDGYSLSKLFMLMVSDSVCIHLQSARRTNCSLNFTLLTIVVDTFEMW
jgi:hypothetical protein